MTIEPDTKDWTWVLERRCPECGFDAGELPVSELASAVRDNAAAWVQVLVRPDARERPDPSVWSPLEYACHVRDVYRLYDARLVMMLVQDSPLFPNWDQDETAVAFDYGSQDPTAVAAALRPAGERLASDLDTLTDAEWERTGRRSDGAVFTVSSIARYLVHDLVHHIHDVTPAP